MFELTGKQAVVTGAASGIGLAIAQLFASQGANVFVIDLNAEKSNAAAAAIKSKAAGTVSGLACDVSSEESVQKTFADITGSIDILVNCAGIAHVGNLQSTSLEDSNGSLRSMCVEPTFACASHSCDAPGRPGNHSQTWPPFAATAGLPDRFGLFHDQKAPFFP